MYDTDLKCRPLLVITKIKELKEVLKTKENDINQYFNIICNNVIMSKLGTELILIRTTERQTYRNNISQLR